MCMRNPTSEEKIQAQSVSEIRDGLVAEYRHHAGWWPDLTITVVYAAKLAQSAIHKPLRDTSLLL